MKVKRSLLAAALPLFLAGGCAAVPEPSESADSGRLCIVCTTFPQYDWTANLIKGNEEDISLILLADKGSDLHNFQPSALDIARVSACDLFIYVGGESDGWVDDALKEAVNPDMHVIKMMDAVSQDLVEEEHEHIMRPHDHQEGTHEAHEADEHVWLSVRNAETIAGKIEAELEALDSAHAGLYQENLERYLGRLSALDDLFADTVDRAPADTLLFADRFPFRYLVEDYELSYHAAFDGCSAETEASFETVAYLIDCIDEQDIGCVLVTESADDRLARVIIENTREKDQQIFVLDSLQSVSSKDIRDGMDYLSVMEDNCRTLGQALGCQADGQIAGDDHHE